MDNYVIHFNESERDAVINIITRTNDIVINHIEPTSVNITIQLERSDEAYEELLLQIERELNAPPINRV
jgi:hypothetical protein